MTSSAWRYGKDRLPGDSVAIVCRGENVSFTKKLQLKRGGEAVSPVVGVMLMLVVTIIIAAVVSAFAGGLTTTKQAAPSLGMDIAIANSGEPLNSYIRFDVQSTNEPIPTSDLKITTSWTTTNRTTGAAISGGNTTEFELNSPNVNDYTTDGDIHQAPHGVGAGVTGVQVASGTLNTNQWFGNYTLIPGTSMMESPSFAYGYTTAYGSFTPDAPYNNLYNYPNDGSYTGSVDGMQAVLGGGWNNLRPGDIVHITIVDTKIGESILEKDVAVTPS